MVLITALISCSVRCSFLSTIAAKIGFYRTIAIKTFIIHFLVNCFFCKYNFIIEIYRLTSLFNFIVLNRYFNEN